MGESGIIFLGIRADYIIKVTEFESGLRGGSIEFPLNDRSMELVADQRHASL